MKPVPFGRSPCSLAGMTMHSRNPVTKRILDLKLLELMLYGGIAQAMLPQVMKIRTTFATKAARVCSPQERQGQV
jgi:hypothetical protein